MHRRKFGGRPYQRYNPVYLENAIRAVRSRRMSIREASTTYAVPRSTLQDKLRGRHMEKVGRPFAITDDDERHLVEGLQLCANWGFPLRVKDIVYIIQLYLNNCGKTVKVFNDNKPGKDWMRRFLRRYKSQLSLKFCENIKRVRAEVSAQTIAEYFEELSKSIEGIPPSNILNYDETNFVDDPGAEKAVVRRGSRHPHIVRDHSKSSVSVMFAGTASGEVLPLYIVYKAKHLYPAWTEKGGEGWRYNRSDSGWFDATIFEDWFFNTCLPYFRRLKGRKLMIGDNLSSHVSIRVVQACEDNNIKFLLLPPNCTHLLQPLDVTFFRPMKIMWRKQLGNWKNKNRGVLPKTEFPALLNTALLSMENRVENMKKGFEATGIYPFNKERVLKNLPDNTPQQPSPHDPAAWSSSFESFLREARTPASNPNPRNRGKKLNLKPGQGLTVKRLLGGESDSSNCEDEDDVFAPMLDSDDDDSFMDEHCNQQREAASPPSPVQQASTPPSPAQQASSSTPEPKQGDFVLVRFNTDRPTGSSEILYVGLVENSRPQDSSCHVKFLRKKVGKKDFFFVFPDVTDKSDVNFSDISKILKTPKVIRGKHTFPDIKSSCKEFSFIR